MMTTNSLSIHPTNLSPANGSGATAAQPAKRKNRYRKPRKPDDIRVRYQADGTYVTAQDGTEVIFDTGDFQLKVAPFSRFLIVNQSGDGVPHVRIQGSLLAGYPKNLIQVSRLVMGLKPEDRRQVFFHNGNHRDMRKENLFTVSKSRSEGEPPEIAFPLAAE